MKRFALLCAVACAVSLPVAAQAATALVTQASDLFAGPGSYPNVAALPTGANVDVVGCVSSYRWCDVTYGPDRGWIATDHLVMSYEGRQVALVDPSLRTTVPIVAFELKPYWEEHYRTRPFFSEEDRWAQQRSEQRLREQANGLR